MEDTTRQALRRAATEVDSALIRLSAHDGEATLTAGERRSLRAITTTLADTPGRMRKLAASQGVTPAGPGPVPAMLARLDVTTNAGRRDAAIVLAGAALGATAGELAAVDIPDVTVTGEGMQIISGQGSANVPRTGDPLCAVEAMARWLSALDALGRQSGPLFIRIDRYGHIAPQLRRKGSLIGDPDGRMSAEAIGDVVARLAGADAGPPEGDGP